MYNPSSLDCNITYSEKTGMTQQQIVLVQKTWKLFRDIKPEVIGDVFYSKLFTEMPALKKLFKHSMQDQYKKLMDMLSTIVGRLYHLDELTTDIAEMARRHAGYGVKPSHYVIVGNTLLWTLEQGLGADWTPEIKEAWAGCYKILSETMINAAGYDESPTTS